jgi:hypothetical protein
MAAVLEALASSRQPQPLAGELLRERVRLAPLLEQHAGITVVRDDLFPGGTKARILPPLLQGAREFVYCTPAYGYAQLALAYAAADASVKATIFCAARKQLHARTLEAQRLGARVLQVPAGYMTVVRARARQYCAVSQARLLPFGLDCPEVLEAIAALARALPVQPAEVWTVAGSGVLTRGLQRAWPEAAFHAIRIGAKPDAGRAQLWQAPEKFEQDAKQPPPFPSCGNYDAKAWRFIRQHAQPGALFWNVAA